jgi:hypothetical protein
VVVALAASVDEASASASSRSSITAHEGGDEHDKPSELIGVTATRLGNLLQCIASPRKRPRPAQQSAILR